jgi:hypothetical protein
MELLHESGKGDETEWLTGWTCVNATVYSHPSQQYRKKICKTIHLSKKIFGKKKELLSFLYYTDPLTRLWSAWDKLSTWILKFCNFGISGHWNQSVFCFFPLSNALQNLYKTDFRHIFKYGSYFLLHLKKIVQQFA